jgi:PAS domain S-box-containing protein
LVRSTRALTFRRIVWVLMGAGAATILAAETLGGWLHIAVVIAIFFAITMAITQFRRDALASISRSEARLQLQIERMPIACITVSPDSIVTSWNPAAERIFGWRAAEIIGKPVAVILPEGFTPQLTMVIERVLRGEVVEQQINGNVTKEGREILCRWSNTPLVTEGEVTGILAMAEDVTEEHQGQRALLQSELRHRNLLNHLPHDVFSLDNDDRYIAVNATASGFFGLSEAEIIGHTAEELGISSDLTALWREKNALTRSTGTSLTFDLTLPGPKPQYVHVIMHPLRDERGAVSGVTGIAIDETERRVAEAERHRLEEGMAHFGKMEALGTLAGGIAHDFNNILSIILTHTLVVERRAKEPVLAGSLEIMKQAVQRGAAISRQILTFARRGEIHTGTVHVVNLIGELRSLITETFPRTIQVSVVSDPVVPNIRADAGQLHQALLNLCINARDAMPEGGSLAIALRTIPASTILERFPAATPRDHLLISVADDGIGMDDETRRRMFEPFFTTKEKAKGTGLGLAMVYGIVNAHGAQVEVESEVGIGTTFRLYFPIESAVETPLIRGDALVSPARGERLLVIDDEPQILEGLEMQLSQAGYAVSTAQNGADAIEHLSNIPDLVLMDLGMPRMGAVALIDALRVLAPKLPIVAMTGYVDPDVHAAVRAAGVTRILQKPFEIQELLAQLRDALSS